MCVCVAVIITMMGTLRWLNQHFFCSDNEMYDCVMFDCKRLVVFFFFLFSCSFFFGRSPPLYLFVSVRVADRCAKLLQERKRKAHAKWLRQHQQKKKKGKQNGNHK